VQGDIVDKFVSVHNQLKQRVTDNNVKEAIDDVLQLIGA